MKVNMIRSLTSVILGSLLVGLTTGCPPKRGDMDFGSGDEDVLDPTGFSSEAGMGDIRFEEGEPVTDVQFETVRFRYDSYQIDSSEIGKIESVASYLQSSRDVRLVTDGHCDERGSRDYNMVLGEHRSQAVRAYLIGLGVPVSRIQTRSFGEEVPADSGHNDAAWQLNRRVEFSLFR